MSDNILKKLLSYYKTARVLEILKDMLTGLLTELAAYKFLDFLSKQYFVSWNLVGSNFSKTKTGNKYQRVKNHCSDSLCVVQK